METKQKVEIFNLGNSAEGSSSVSSSISLKDLVPTGPTVMYASFLQRYFAALIDSFVLWLPFVVVQIVMIPFLSVTLNGITASVNDPAKMSKALGPIITVIVIWAVIAMLVSFGYYIIADKVYGQTVGKRIMGIKIVSVNGGNITYKQAILREIFGKWLSGLFFNLGYLWAIFDSKKQGWHDKIAESIVIRA